MKTRDDFWRPLDQAELPIVDAARAARAAHMPPAIDGAARLLTLAGEHGHIWHLIAAVGGLADRPRRVCWRAVNVAVLAAYAVNTAVKLTARRARPPGGEVEVRLALSFPSAHAATSAAAVVASHGLLPRRLTWPLALKLVASRLYFGVHYPSDLLAGGVLGVLVGTIVRRATLRRWRTGTELTRAARPQGE